MLKLDMGWLLFAALAFTASCSSDDSASGTSAKGQSCAATSDCAKDLKCVGQVCVPDLPAGFCQQYATLCPAENLDVAECESKCVTLATSASKDDCWFAACGAQVGKCDNQEPSDTSIMKCASDHGWN